MYYFSVVQGTDHCKGLTVIGQLLFLNSEKCVRKETFQYNNQYEQNNVAEVIQKNDFTKVKDHWRTSAHIKKLP